MVSTLISNRVFLDAAIAAALSLVAIAITIFLVPSYSDWDLQSLSTLMAAALIGWFRSPFANSSVATAIGAATVPAFARALAPLVMPANFQEALYPAAVTDAVCIFLASCGAAMLAAACRVAVQGARPVA